MVRREMHNNLMYYKLINKMPDIYIPIYLKITVVVVNILLKTGIILSATGIPLGIYLKIKNRKTHSYSPLLIKFFFLLGPGILALTFIVLIVGVMISNYIVGNTSQYPLL